MTRVIGGRAGVCATPRESSRQPGAVSTGGRGARGESDLSTLNLVMIEERNDDVDDCGPQGENPPNQSGADRRTTAIIRNSAQSDEISLGTDQTTVGADLDADSPPTEAVPNAVR